VTEVGRDHSVLAERGTIVVGVDGSEDSRLAVMWAAVEARLRDSLLRIVYAGTSDPTTVPAWYSSTPATMSAGQAIVDDAFALVATGHPSVLLETELPVASPTRVLVEASRTADLVVVGARGQGGFKELLLGSVSQRVIHRATSPVVVVRPVPDAIADVVPVPRIVVGVDGSASSELALRWALREAELRSGSVEAVFACVIAPMTGFMNSASAGYEAAGRPIVEAAAARAAEWRPNVPFHVVTHFAATVPALLASCDGAQLLVVGSGGQGSHRHLVLGSVADQCTRHAACPVAVVR
jgi:nucleotide-binding universal stress UspA family protein